jgi:hypothetical protein
MSVHILMYIHISISVCTFLWIHIFNHEIATQHITISRTNIMRYTVVTPSTNGCSYIHVYPYIYICIHLPLDTYIQSWNREPTNHDFANQHIGIYSRHTVHEWSIWYYFRHERKNRSLESVFHWVQLVSLSLLSPLDSCVVLYSLDAMKSLLQLWAYHNVRLSWFPRTSSNVPRDLVLL